MSIDRIGSVFKVIKKEGRKAFIAYVCGGDPDFETSLQILNNLAEAGSDILEIGVPFSDPLADGPTNQMAADRALQAGMTTEKIFRLVADFRKIHQTPIVLFTYLNPVFTYGYEAFYAQAASVGVDGVLVLDLPIEQRDLLWTSTDRHNIKSISLIAPNTSPKRAQIIANQAEGFIYLLSRTGVTGSGAPNFNHLEKQIASLKLTTTCPICVGFGIQTADQAKQAATYADGIIVGSTIVSQIAKHPKNPPILTYLSECVKPLIQATKFVI